MSLRRGLLIGAVGGAAGTTALNAITYLDMALRGRPSSNTPQDTVEKLAEKADVRIPGDDESRRNRIDGLGSLTGLAAGIGVGAALGLARTAGWRAGPAVTSLAATVGALVASNGPMTALGVTDLRSWTSMDWVSDVIPHLAYGAVAAGTVIGLDRSWPRPR